ncbi:MAG: tryptophan synthase subunit alpha [Candidatus Firestonebacteria bacterium]|mgnify:CR=1 FL=1
MNRIDKKFIELKKENKKAFIPYIVSGDPSIYTTYELLLEFDKIGVDIVELGVPFSDPLADGPTIQRAYQRSLKKGTNLDSILKLVKRFRKKSQMPVVLMCYYNLIFKYGIKKFSKDAYILGVDGVIIPDLPVEEAKIWKKEANLSNIATIFLASPTSTSDRLKMIADLSSGFIYYVSLTGVTGERKVINTDIKKSINNIRNWTDKPIAVGFGVSTPKQAKEMIAFCDGVIVGSAIVRKIEENIKKQNIVSNTSKFVQSFVNAIH